ASSRLSRTCTAGIRKPRSWVSLRRTPFRRASNCPPWAWSTSGISRYPTSIDSGSTGRTSSQPSAAIGAADAATGAGAGAAAAPMAELGWDEVRPVEPLSMEVGYRLIPLDDQAQGGQ